MHLTTRFAQLEVASALELWTEGFRTVEDIHQFFNAPTTLQQTNIHLMRKADGRSSGDAYAVFDSEEAAVEALQFDKQKLGSRWFAWILRA